MIIQIELIPLVWALSPIRRATVRLALVFVAAALLAGCRAGPPPPPPPQDPAQAKAEEEAREDFVRNLPKPPER